MKKLNVGIRFSDNDYYTTLYEFFDYIKDFDPDNVTKERIVFLFNSLATGIYCVKQHRFGYGRDDWDASKDLKITEDNVYLGDEVDKQLTIDNNCEFQFVELIK